MRTAALLTLLVATALPTAVRADVEDLSGSEARRSRRPPTFAIRAEGGTDFAPYGKVGVCGSYFTDNGLGGFEIELGGGAGFPGLQLGVAARQLFGDAGDYLVFEISVAGNTIHRFGADPAAGRFTDANSWTSAALGFEHRLGWLNFSVTGGLSFLTSFDFVPHGMIHGGLGFSF